MVYPPGVLVLFAPLAVLGQFWPMSRAAFGTVGVLVTLAIAHLAFAAGLKALSATRRAGSLIVTGAVLWLFLLRMGMNGFFDGAWLACGALMVHRLATGRPTSALRWFALASLLHFRAAILVPLAAAALWRALRQERRPWLDLALLGLALAVCLGTFALMFPVTSAYRDENPSLLQLHHGARFWLVVLVGLAGTACAVAWADLVTAATVAGATVLALIYKDFWWHGSVVLIAPLAVSACREGRAPVRAREAILVWLLLLQPLAWRDPIVTLIGELASLLKL
jgi:hypothetical protein